MQSDWLLKQQRFERSKMSGKKEVEKFRPPKIIRAWKTGFTLYTK